MELLWIILGAILIIVGFLGAFLPVLPGLPFSYVGLLLLQLTPNPPFSTQFLVIWAVIVVALMILDNMIPIWGTKKFGGSNYGVWGCTIGMVFGMFFFPPFGLILGPLAGAFVGELIGGQQSDKAFKAALGSFAGFLAGTGLKIAAAGAMGFYFFTNITL